MRGWSVEQMPELSGRRVVITGANGGLGLESALALARRGAEVVLACRNAERAQRALERVRAVASGAAPSVVRLDLSSLASVEAAAGELLARFDRVDVLMNNAGVMALPERRVTVDGFEQQFAANHLGHFALTLRLLPALLAAGAAGGRSARVVTLGSVAHRLGRIRIDDLQWERAPYSAWGVYGQSKLATMLFAFELDRRAKAAGVPVLGVSAHPGYSATKLQSSGPLDGGGLQLANRLMALTTPLVAQSARAGALGQLRAASDPSVVGGEYLGPTFLFGWRGRPHHAAMTPFARDEVMAARLWEASEELTGLRFADVVRDARAS